VIRAAHILIVNDDEDTMFLLSRLILHRFADATITECTNAADALRALTTERVDLIITDNRMPGMDGLTMVRTVRTRDRVTPIVMLTGSDDLEAAALSAGVTKFVPSVQWSEVATIIEGVLQRS
jgi:CheY-like chemotaxis protein